jgi:ComF family protein
MELIVPIPLHPKKEYKRGYNQSMLIARGIEEVSGVKCTDLLQRIENSGSQTRKGKYDRWLNVSSAFWVNPNSALKNRNIVLIDDVVTTGATLEAAVSALLSAGVKKVSIATVASA